MVMIRSAVSKKVVATKIVAEDGSGDFIDIQDGIDALPSIGGVVYIKEGSYPITSPITFPNHNISLFGAGKSTRLEVSSNITSIAPGIGKSYISIQDLLIIGNSTGSSQNGIDLSYALKCMINSVWIEELGGNGITLTGDTNNNIFIGNFITTVLGNGIHIEAASSLQSGGIISGNIIQNATGAGINLLSTGAGELNKIFGMIINGNDISANGTGIKLSTGSGGSVDNNTINNNQVNLNTNEGINLADAGCANNMVMGNVCVENAEQIIDNGTNNRIGPNVIDSTGNFYITGKIIISGNAVIKLSSPTASFTVEDSHGFPIFRSDRNGVKWKGGMDRFR